MTFGEHLEELRRRILFGLIAFAVAFAAAFAFQDELMFFFTRPYERARAEINAQLVEDWAKTTHDHAAATRLVDELLKSLESKPGLIDAETAKKLHAIQEKELEHKPPQLDTMQSIASAEYFGAYMLDCLLAASLVGAPFFLLQLWKFVAEGLYEHERSIVLRILPFSLALFFAGFAFGYFVLAKMSVRFLIGYGDLTLVKPQVSIGAYQGLLFLLLLVMGLVFQIPLVMTVLAAVGIAKPEFFRTKRKYFILGIFIVAAIITPPDYISQLLVAGPMLLLFELGIFLAAAAAKRRAAGKDGNPAPAPAPAPGSMKEKDDKPP